MEAPLTFATRPSALARWQTDHVAGLLRAAWPGLETHTDVITTRGDLLLDRPLPEIGGKGLFTAELEEALRSGRVDAAVHSLKDLPTEDSEGLVIGAIPARADPRDAWICPAGYSLDDIPAGAVVGTSSTRRRSHLLHRRPDLDVRSIRGNVDTRLRKARDGEYDAIVLAAAGVLRLGLGAQIGAFFPLDVILPAPGQGALAVQCRADDHRTRALIAAIEDPAARTSVLAERAFLERLGGGCSLPVGAHATVSGGTIRLAAMVASPDGDRRIDLSGQGGDPLHLGADLAEEALALGALALMAAAV